LATADEIDKLSAGQADIFGREGADKRLWIDVCLGRSNNPLAQIPLQVQIPQNGMDVLIGNSRHPAPQRRLAEIIELARKLKLLDGGSTILTWLIGMLVAGSKASSLSLVRASGSMR